MAIWMVRAGSGGQYEQKFLQEERVYVTWDGLDVDLADLSDRAELLAAMSTRYPDAKPKALTNHASQVWPFATEMRIGDLITLPLKSQPAIQVGEIKGDYQFEPAGPNPYYHWRQVESVGEAVPRANFGKDLLYTFGAFMTICRVQRNNAEARITAMRAGGWKPESIAGAIKVASDDALPPSDEDAQNSDLENLGEIRLPN